MLINKIEGSSLKIKVGEKKYSSNDISKEIKNINREIESIDIEKKLIGLCLSDSYTQFILSVALWDRENVIMYINSQNGKEYAHKIAGNYFPHYIFMERTFYEENHVDGWCLVKEFSLTGCQLVVCELQNGNDNMKEYRGCIFFTSGTTDVPKAVFRSEENMKNDALSNIQSFDITSEDKLLMVVPFGHVYGLGSGVIPFALQGATIYWTNSFISGRGLKRIIEEEGITAIIASPMIYKEILTAGIDVKNCRLMLSAGSKLSSKLAEEFYATYGKIINNMYGSSETGAIATLYGDDVISTDNTNCGRPMHSVTVSCEGAIGKEEVIRVKSDSIAEGVLVDGKLQALADADGWFEMSDMGYIDEKGCIHLICRKDDMINIGGEKLNPKTIERIAEEYYEQSLVLTENSEDGVCYPVLYIEAPQIDFPMLKDKLMERLSYKFVPKKVIVYDKFPKNNNGKIDRARLRSKDDRRTEYECY